MTSQIEFYQQQKFAFFTFKKLKTKVNDKGEEKKYAEGLPMDEKRKQTTHDTPL